MLHLAQEMAAAEAALQPHVQAATAAAGAAAAGARAAAAAGAAASAEASELSPEAMQLTAVLLPPGLLLLRLARQCAAMMAGGQRQGDVQSRDRSFCAFHNAFGGCGSSVLRAALKDDTSPWGCWLGSNDALVSTRV